MHNSTKKYGRRDGCFPSAGPPRESGELYSGKKKKAYLAQKRERHRQIGPESNDSLEEHVDEGPDFDDSLEEHADEGEGSSGVLESDQHREPTEAPQIEERGTSPASEASRSAGCFEPSTVATPVPTSFESPEAKQAELQRLQQENAELEKEIAEIEANVVAASIAQSSSCPGTSTQIDTVTSSANFRPTMNTRANNQPRNRNATAGTYGGYNVGNAAPASAPILSQIKALRKELSALDGEPGWKNCLKKVVRCCSQLTAMSPEQAKESGASLAAFEMVQQCLQSGPLKGAKPGYFKRCGAEIASDALFFLSKLPDTATGLHFTENQRGMIMKWVKDADKAANK